MRRIGLAERALETMCSRVKSRVAFGKPFAEQGVIAEWIAESRIEIDQARLLTLHAAQKMDVLGVKAARSEIDDQGRCSGDGDACDRSGDLSAARPVSPMSTA